MPISAALGSSALLPAGLGFRNLLINGDFRINQRGITNQTNTSEFGHDRWRVYGTGGISYAPTAFATGTQPLAGYPSTSFARVTASSQTLSSHHCLILQQIEDVNTLQGSTCTISFYARAQSGTPKVAVELRQLFGTGGSTQVILPVGFTTINTSWVRYSFQYRVPSTLNSTVGAGSNLMVLFWISAGSDYAANASSIGLQNATIDFWGMQVEQNTQPTPFEQRPIGVELALCQRYYWRSTPGLTTDAQNRHAHFRRMNQYAYIASGHCSFPVPMRAEPSVALYNGNGLGAVDAYGVGQESYVVATGEGISQYGVGMFVKYTNSSLTTTSNFNVDATSVTYWANIEASAEL